ncbi:BTB/POZ domain-containing protein 6-like [Paramacrobiotus metropolitanus]|uniref:BTB/POZ domain-containing protein 6-like n=1 Tax=Paramacrobiotus metropolitanus TaxID=2943436 RepID=UPI002445C3A8|nr:BTB/POZ domain-containing protein 6-like [Paramacrobiotus metropolitanus]
MAEYLGNLTQDIDAMVECSSYTDTALTTNGTYARCDAATMAQKSTSFESSKRRGKVSQVVNRWKNALEKNDLCDVKFAVGRLCGEVEIIYAHKLALSLSSDVFHNMLNGSVVKRAGTAIDIPDIPPDAFHNMLSYIYTGSVEDLQLENAVQTLFIADKYDLPWLAELCSDFILDDVGTRNCLLYLENALRWSPNCDRVVEACLDVIDESIEAVFQSSYFTKLERKTLERILQRSTLSAGENVVYVAVEKWAAAACARKKLPPSPSNRRRMLGGALFLVRFALLNEAQLANGPVQSGLLKDKEVARLLLCKHKTGQGPLEFSTEPRKRVMCRITSKYVYKMTEKIFIQYDNGYWYPAAVTGDDKLNLYRENKLEREEERGGIHRRRKTVRAADILKRGLAVEAYIDGGYKKATYGALRAGRHTVDIADREYNVEFVQLKIARRHVEEWKAARK